MPRNADDKTLKQEKGKLSVGDKGKQDYITYAGILDHGKYLKVKYWQSWSVFPLLQSELGQMQKRLWFKMNRVITVIINVYDNVCQLVIVYVIKSSGTCMHAYSNTYV